MSYDVYVEFDTGGPEPLDVWCGNYTSNVSGMWAKCLTAALTTHPDLAHLKGADARRMILEWPDVDYYRNNLTKFEERLGLRDLGRQRAGDMVPLLDTAIAWGFEHIDELREDNPPNGWGDAEGAITYLLDIKNVCEAHPNGEIRVSS